MSFSLRFKIDQPDDESCKLGTAVIAETVENFEAYLSDWSPEDYEAHWSATAALAPEARQLAFATSIARHGWTSLWLMQRESDQYVAIQVLLKRRKLAFDGRVIKPSRKLFGVEAFSGLDCSRWWVPVESVVEFARSVSAEA